MDIPNDLDFTIDEDVIRGATMTEGETGGVIYSGLCRMCGSEEIEVKLGETYPADPVTCSTCGALYCYELLDRINRTRVFSIIVSLTCTYPPDSLIVVSEEQPNAH